MLSAKRRARRRRIRRAVADPKSTNSLLLMLFGFILFGFASGIGSELAKKFVDKGTEKVGQVVRTTSI